MNWDKFKEFLLANIPGANLASGGKVINARCRECPDSSNLSSKHFYIIFPKKDGAPVYYYCHKCHCSGVVTHKKLIAWGLYDKDVNLDLLNYNESIKYNPSVSKYFNNQTYRIYNTQTTIDESSIRKLNYINERIGTNLSFNDLKKLKIVINLLDLIKENRIEKLTRDYNIISDLDKFFIGFLSIDNAFLNMRKTVADGMVYSSIDKRYINYKIFDKFETSQRFYTIPSTINLSKPERIKIHIAEGPFDILSIYLNLRNKEEGIYSSVTGSNYMNNIMYFLLDVQLPYVEFHFYPDNDKYGSMKRMNYIISRIPDKSIPVYIHKNDYYGEKDFGVPVKRIKESIMKVN